jgi:tetratricopeptide (TPR) repeat protein
MSVPAVDVQLERARHAARLRQADPSEALALAEAVLGDEASSGPAMVVALVAKGMAVRELGDLVGSRRHHEEAIDRGDRLGLGHEVALARSSLAGVLSDLGEPELALAEADRVMGMVTGTDLAELEVRRARAFERMGRISESIDAYTRAIDVIDESGDDILRARVRCNRGITLVYGGRVEAATHDFAVAEELAVAQGHDLLAGGAAVNLGFVLGRRGEIVAALDAFERARGRYARIDFPGRARGVFEADRCAVLLAAGLTREARSSAAAGVEALESVADVVDLAEARLLLGRACLAAGDAAAAVTHCARAAEEFRTAGRPGWLAMARYTTLRARVASGAVEGWDREAGAVIDALDHHGWSTEANDVRIFVAELALRHGDTRRARRELRRASQARRSGRVDRRAQAWLATAILRRSDGDRRGAFAALRAGLRIIDEHRALLGATELRVGASSHAVSLAALGQHLALESDRPSTVLRWADRLRASTLTVLPTRPPDDEVLAGDLVALRSARADLEAARLAGNDDRDARRRVGHLESAISERARRVSARDDGTRRELRVADIDARLSPARFVEYLEDEGNLHAVTVTRGRAALHHLGPASQLVAPLDGARFALQRLATRRGSAAARTAALASLVVSLDELGRILIDDLVPPGRGAVVIVPTGALHLMPWAGLPRLRARPLTVSPSASIGLAGGRVRPAQRRSTGVALVSGPDLPGGRTEVQRLRRANGDSTILTGRNATVSATLDALGSARVAHIAAHGEFRADSPMFSSLRLYDGPLTVYDLEGLRSVPETVVLPACDAGVADVRAGDELLGTASALLGLGVANVVAPVAALPDEQTAPVMLRFHRHLSTGLEPASALAMAAAPCWTSDDPADAAVAAAMTCFGVYRGADVSRPT